MQLGLLNLQASIRGATDILISLFTKQYLSEMNVHMEFILTHYMKWPNYLGKEALGKSSGMYSVISNKKVRLELLEQLIQTFFYLCKSELAQAVVQFYA